MLTRNASSRFINGLVHGAVVFALGAAGCAADEVAEVAEVESKTQELVTQNETVFASVWANGTGCPEGSWNTEISPDGKVFTTTFSEYTTSVDQNSSTSIKDCQLSIKLRSPGGLSYAVSTFSYSGYAFLDPNVSARVSARYYFQGNSLGPDSNRQTLWGPYDNSYVFEDNIQTKDWVWSPCGAERDLNIQTRLIMQNGDPRGNGYANLAAIDARAETKLVVKLSWRTCD